MDITEVILDQHREQRRMFAVLDEMPRDDHEGLGAIWAIVCLTTGEFIHPWWLYVAAPPGAILGVLYAAGIGRPES